MDIHVTDSAKRRDKLESAILTAATRLFAECGVDGTSIATVAERTRHIRLGTGVSSLPYHHPLMLADRINQLDHITRGRTMFGVGPGALPSDAFMMGIPVSTQRDRMMRFPPDVRHRPHRPPGPHQRTTLSPRGPAQRRRRSPDIQTKIKVNPLAGTPAGHRRELQIDLHGLPPRHAKTPAPAAIPRRSHADVIIKPDDCAQPARRGQISSLAGKQPSTSIRLTAVP